MASTSAWLPSLKCTVWPSIFVNRGFSVIWDGHFNPSGFVRHVIITLVQPNLRHCSAISSAEKLAPINSILLSLNSLASRKSCECRTRPGKRSIPEKVGTRGVEKCPVATITWSNVCAGRKLSFARFFTTTVKSSLAALYFTSFTLWENRIEDWISGLEKRPGLKKIRLFKRNIH